MTRNDLACVHEPFGDAFYYGPERMSTRFEGDAETRDGSGFATSTYRTIFDRLEREGEEGKRVFIKDIAYYLLPPEGKPAQIAPSLAFKKRGIGTEKGQVNGTNDMNGINGDTQKLPFPYETEGELDNPTVVPRSMLEQFHFTFLIRDPHSSIPSYYRCTIPPLEEMTGFHDFDPHEAGYDELRRLFDYLRSTGQVGPDRAGVTNGDANGVAFDGDVTKAELCVVDADDLLDDPEGILKIYCDSVGLDYTPNMLNWDNEKDQTRAQQAFEKWKGFHEDALESKDLKPRAHVRLPEYRYPLTGTTNARQKKAVKSEEQWDREWKQKYGDEAAQVIRQTVNESMDDFLYLKQFAIKV